MSTEKPKAWERREGETDKAFEAFQLYLDVGNLVEVYRSLSGQKKAKEASGQYKDWYNGSEWKKRRQEWTDHLAKKRREKIIERQNRLIDKSYQVLEDALATSLPDVTEFDGYGLKPKSYEEMPEEARRALKKIKFRKGEGTEIDLPDKTIIARDLLKGFGELVNRQELTGKGGGPIETKDNSPLSSLPPEKLARIMAIMNEPDKKPLEEDE